MWALGQRALGHLNYEISNLTWCQDIGADFFDVEVKLQIRDHKFDGRGTSNVQKSAVAIAITEAFERVVAGTLRTGSNGLAANENCNLAMDSAKNELIERDALMVSYHCGSSVVSLSTDSIGTEYQASIRYLNEAGQCTELFGLAKTFDRYVVACITSGLTKSSEGEGIKIGLGCDRNLKTASEKATMEAIRSGMWATPPNHGIESLTLRQFQSLSTHTARNHLSLALDPAYGSIVLGDFKSRASATEFPVFPCDGEFLFVEHNWPRRAPKPPLKFVQCQNKSLQNLFWGPTQLSKLNTARLSSVSENWKTRINSLPPHPLG